MLIQRTKYIRAIANASTQVPIVVLIGARQVGKTSIMETCKLPGRSLHINGQDPEVAEQFQKLSVLENFIRINLDKNLNGNLFIDEFQFIPDISLMLKLLADKHKKLRMICSGSSSLDIAGKISESLAGRARMIPVYGLSFAEFVQFKDDRLYNKLLKYRIGDPQSIVDKRIPLLLQEYLLYGGLPKVALEDNYDNKTALLNDIYQTYILRDVRNYVKDQDFVKFNKLIKFLAAQIGGMVNISALSVDTGLKYHKCEEYLHLLEQMFIIRLISPFATNKRKEVNKMKKVYYYDTGMRNIIYNNFVAMDTRLDNGPIFENFAYLELARKVSRPENIFYYRTKDGLEVDFIVDEYGRLTPFEVKYKTYDKPPRSDVFGRVDDIFTFKRGYLINMGSNYVIGKTQFLPAWLAEQADIRLSRSR